ncbi:MAG TPA: VWA domain-containing protein [Acidimicrobiales bacterium]|nr:VWA domain-containing protein [Acidimicrobiales bacterium]
MARRFGYSRWDGSQAGFELDADDVLGEITDDLLYHGEISPALRRLLQQGFRDRTGERVAGLQELLERLRSRRQEMLDDHDLGGVYDAIADELRAVVESERASIDQLADQAQRSGDQRRQEITGAAMAERRLRLDLLPPDLAGRVRALKDYPFTSSDAQERFEGLLDRLRKELLQSQFDQMAGALGDLSPEQVERMREMFSALNALLEMRAAGQDTTAAFDQFMAAFGDMVPGRPADLDELLEQLAAQMAAAQAMFNSMSPEQRAQIQALSDELLGDLDLRWQVERLAHNLQQAFPGAGWDRAYRFRGQDPLGLVEGTSVLNELGELDDLEQLLRSAVSPGALADVDVERARQLLGPDSARALEHLARLSRTLEEAGLVERREGRLELTPKGLRRIGRNALTELFSRLAKDRLGRHQLERAGTGPERAHETKPYEFGDPFDLNIERTLRNALVRRGAGAGLPVRLLPDDFEVERSEALTRTSTVLMLDLSLSMPMRDNFLAAKKVAVALHALISSQFPRDYLGIVGFSEVARELQPNQLPEVSWDFVFGTNIQHGLALARRMLTRQSGTRQIILITDGEPTAHIRADGEPFFHYPPVRETVDATLTEVNRCTRDGIRINTFMLDADSALTDFVEKLTELNGGRTFFTTPETLGDYLLVDFLDQRRATRRRGSGAPRPPQGRRPA